MNTHPLEAITCNFYYFPPYKLPSLSLDLYSDLVTFEL